MTTTTAPETSPPESPARRPSATSRALWLVLAVLVLAFCGLLSVTFGARDIAWEDLVAALGGGQDNISQAAVAKRIPRTILAMLVGASLGLAGAVMQGVTRNPLADPGILGVTSGASLFVVVGIAFFGMSSSTAYIWVAMVGAAVSATFVYAVGSLGRGGATPLKLALAGAATSAAFGSLISAVLLPRIDVMDSFRFWQIGGVGGATYPRIMTAVPFLVVGALVCLAVARGLNALALGDELAAGLGERVILTRILSAVGAVMLCGAATAIAGPIGFVGLVVPHACRLLVGLDHRWLLPFSMVVGATLLTVADVVGRVVARPAEVDVGIITALVGAPVFIAVVRRMRGRAL
ncbi:ABC-type Fe3+-siderophore transport system, permease component [Serinicoccus hydrothermalis]|uniref:ABC-type Fe3+-siderophore transport system, permease component n=1 Tax=Serinicoccus hydrothermalis TaxID=1758689 RepID=A0A1B1NDY5_9MICO|nr:iron ABC transporter permease [Serinicoccus hydrothermalis]ANS79658.1 ABC-type Fe3+-siderophore transport system, permease component [Serinicoccus hydrothermalis]